MRNRIDRYFLRGCYADNVTANPGSAGATFGSAELTFSGDTVQVPLTIPGLLTGSEGGYTYTLVVGGSGVVTGGTQRVTLATDVALPTGSNVIGAVTQSGTWNITNVSGTISLPTGAATAAKQPALGSAGTASTDVITVQGIASMTPVLATLSGTNNIATVSTVTSVSQWAGTAIDVNSGNKGNGTLRVVLATDQPQLTNKLLVTPDANSAVNMAQLAGNTLSSGNGASGTGTFRVSIASDSTGIVQPVPGTAGGLLYSVANPSANSNNKTQAKGSAGQLYFISIQNIQSVPVYLKIFDKTSANVTAGTTACDYQFMCPANATAANGAGVVFNFEPGIAHANAITWMLTTGIANNDNTSVAANSQLVTIGYK